MTRLARKRSTKASGSECKQGQTTPLKKLQKTESTMSESVAGADVGLPKPDTEEVISLATGDGTLQSRGKHEDKSEKVINQGGDNCQDLTSCVNHPEKGTEKQKDDAEVQQDGNREEKERKTISEEEISVSKEDSPTDINTYMYKDPLKTQESAENTTVKNGESFADVIDIELQHSTESVTSVGPIKTESSQVSTSIEYNKSSGSKVCHLSSETTTQDTNSNTCVTDKSLAPDASTVGCVKLAESTTASVSKVESATSKNDHQPGVTSCTAQPVIESKGNNQMALTLLQNKDKLNTPGNTYDPVTAKTDVQAINKDNSIERIAAENQVTDQPIALQDTNQPFSPLITDEPISSLYTNQLGTQQVTDHPNSADIEDQRLTLSKNTDQLEQSALEPVTLSQGIEKPTSLQIVERYKKRDSSVETSQSLSAIEINTDNPGHQQFNMEHKLLPTLPNCFISEDDAVKTETDTPTTTAKSETESKGTCKDEDLQSESLEMDTQPFMPTADQVCLNSDDVDMVSYARPGGSVPRAVGQVENMMEDGDITDSQLCSMEWEARDTMSSDTGPANRTEVGSPGKPVRVVSPDTGSPAQSRPADGTKVVQGLIKELFSINQSLINTKREMEAVCARQQGKENHKPHTWR
ncbi:uncharacterized protein LOC135480312 isoform X2 [Liolophura sinensis]|uniref:uncharacterized protein LOC135480312 isoform X2 n=1 Tax=Liolophura sinensis TaxID=3198878 RepID=UPI003158800E